MFRPIDRNKVERTVRAGKGRRLDQEVFGLEHRLEIKLAIDADRAVKHVCKADSAGVEPRSQTPELEGRSRTAGSVQPADDRLVESPRPRDHAEPEGSVQPVIARRLSIGG